MDGPGADDATPVSPVADGARSQRTRRLVIGLCGVATAAGIVLGVLGVVAFGDASSARDDAAELRRERVRLERQGTQLEESQVGIVDARRALDAAAEQFRQRSEQALSRAIDRVFEVFNRAIEQGNTGDVAGARQVFETEGRAVVAELDDALTRAKEQLDEMRARAEALREATGD